ncbi:(2S)-3-sulfopropanediol dehydratase [Citrobacter sp. ESY80]|jgi:formate C-acetyltransferase|uniref:(2S)-3-sulfopropanediol dehydratase n=1 Tax=Citrobacter TaxID=544 RepID=UPI0003069CCD|nr:MULTISPECIES: formate C-acetyltransferase/glycerol dehydratase family glycyl radical enzyme [Citrobacter]EMC3650958.1 formate C-acetyltransferase/glycerol dehydratase family glycyl radical enzyme [Citrobacter braakii]MBJ9525166.1 formate C-acetyltransferase/glycerol dehydratase family glycyl radical enzyme [Citrobacter braakii]MDE9583328.1 formate C-acetyltransferase/glycerol dehydratase family glycyl radical enzyme [Citrobacter braakii]MDT7129621.1 formate C-acetyltransferase/glycerol dehyd
MKVHHTTANGTQDFDKTYSLGYQVNHEDWSPFPRVNRLRQTFLDRPYDIDVERLRLVTEAYKKHENAPRKLKCAYAFENILLNTTLYIYDEDLILGEIAAPAKASPIYPEFSVSWIIDEILHSPFEERANDQFYIRNEEERQEIVELCRYWEGKTVDDLINSRLEKDQTKGSEVGEKIFQTNLYHYAGAGHLAIDYACLMKLGYNGLIANAQAGLKKLSLRDTEYGDKRDFYQAMIIELEAAKKYILRYAHLAHEYAEKECNPQRKQELETMALNCQQIAGGAPQTFWQALQLFNFATSMIQIESNGHSISYGRMDQWLYPWFDADMKNNTISKEFALELIEVQYVKMNNPTKLKDKGTVAVRNGRGFGGESLTLGGVDRNGNDATNDLTMLMLEGSAHTRMMNPWVCVRMHENTPYELKIKTVECIRAGYGHPKIFNDAPSIKGMMRKGMTLEEARDYCVVGCVELDLAGKEYGWHDAAYVNTPKMMEMVLNGGRSLSTGEQLGPDTGSLDTYQSFEEVLASVDKQFEYWTDQMCSSLNIIDNAHRALKPVPYVSAFYEDCMASGKDLTEGGAKYNGIAPQAAGMATCADSLATIKQLVFDEQRYSGAQLLQAVKDNWVGHEKLYALVNSSKVHHYGNDIDYADDLFKFMFECYCRHISGRKTPRGGEFSPGVYSVNANVGMGLNTNASVDGRKKFEPISDNMGPVHTDGGSHDICGPTALVNSVTKVDHSLATNGTLMNLRFPQEAVAGVEGRDNLVSFIDEYIAKQAMHVQFNIMSSATMRAAQKKPEDYKDMLVRVAGYSAYFVELGKPLQKDLIQRTELHF